MTPYPPRLNLLQDEKSPFGLKLDTGWEIPCTQCSYPASSPEADGIPRFMENHFFHHQDCLPWLGPVLTLLHLPRGTSWPWTACPSAAMTGLKATALGLKGLGPERASVSPLHSAGFAPRGAVFNVTCPVCTAGALPWAHRVLPRDLPWKPQHCFPRPRSSRRGWAAWGLAWLEGATELSSSMCFINEFHHPT